MIACTRQYVSYEAAYVLQCCGNRPIVLAVISSLRSDTGASVTNVVIERHMQ
jgi:hypothetical protein